MLRERGLDTLLITGTVTNVCCESTARDAMMLNFKTIMMTDGNAAITDEDHNAALSNFYLTFGDIMSTDFRHRLPQAECSKGSCRRGIAAVGRRCAKVVVRMSGPGRDIGSVFRRGVTAASRWRRALRSAALTLPALLRLARWRSPQVVPPNQGAGRERFQFEQPAAPRARPGGPAISLPSTTAPAGAKSIQIFVSRVHIVGSTVYSDADLAPLYEGLIGQRVPLQAVYDLAQRITAKYGADGYILSRAIVPVQELEPRGAVVRIEVVEGYVERVVWPERVAALPRLLHRLRAQDHRRPAGQHPHARALSAARQRPAGAALHHHAEGLAEAIAAPRS